MQALAFQNDLQVTLLQALVHVGPGLRRPVAAIPQHDGAAAVLTLGNDAFEVAVVERMVLDLDGKPTLVGVERGSLGHGP